MSETFFIEQDIEGLKKKIKKVTDVSNSMFYNAKQYGVKGDGVTDDSPALNSLVLLINANGGGVIFLPKGNYKLLSKVVWKSNVSLKGVGVGISILKPYDSGTASGFPAIGFNAGDFAYDNPMVNCRFENFEIDGSNMTSPTYSVYSKGIFIQYLRNCLFKDIYIHHTVATGLGVDYLDKTVIDNVVVSTCGRLWNSALGLTGGAGIGIGTGGLQNENCIITNCQVAGCGSYGIFVEDQILFFVFPHYTSTGILISNNIVRSGVNHGIGIKGGDKITISNNQIYSNAKAGIYVGDLDASNISIENNGIYANQTGISFGASSTYKGISIKDNSINENTGTGVNISGSSISYFNFINNEINETSGGSAFVFNTMSTTIPSYVVLKNNRIIKNSLNGIKYLAGGQAVEISDNLCVNNTGSGIFLDGLFYRLGVLNNRCYTVDSGFQSNGILQNSTSTISYGRIEMNDTRTSGTGLTLGVSNTNTIANNNI